MSRPGSRAVQLGPCLATAGVGPLLFQDAWHRHAGEFVFLDVPTGNAQAVQLAEAQGLTVQRRLVRMVRGDRMDDRVEALWAGFGPEKG
jgi:hypothetical protein